MNHLMVALTDAAATDAGRFGPKAANQALLGQSGLPVPDGFCVDAEAYRLQLDFLGLTETARTAATLEPLKARRYISEVRLGLYQKPIMAPLLESLVTAWRELAGHTGALTVVRSSALMEDGAGSNFAGQFETFLGLDNETDFLTAVRACWAALWSSRALQYMEGHGVSPADTAMALLVQPLVAAHSSGGGMSPTADGGMSLTATWGLGSAIAQGEVVPDRYELGNDGEVLETAAGRKHHSVHCARHDAEPASRAVSRDKVSQPCLHGAQVAELGQLMKKAEGLLGVPVEIEWALDEAGFKLLQARPLHMEPAQVPDEIWLRHPGLKGHPSGVGWGAGRACVINCECELSRVAPGDILVTKVAGPALSQVLPRVSGVVAELGGSTSHLASLARERGIPMVLGVLEATHKIPDGAQVGVDGVMGMVRWIS
ncbi:MAG: PEP/pyruvate-binding domain-containing protein [Gammaproteobacteria bacterium]